MACFKRGQWLLVSYTDFMGDEKVETWRRVRQGKKNLRKDDKERRARQGMGFGGGLDFLSS